MIPYFKLFQFLQKHPTANYSQMAKSLDISDKTAKSRYENLLSGGYISGVRAKYIPEQIGLQTNTYLLTVPDMKRVEFIEKLADFHNFTTFRNRILGSLQGIFIQFDLPSRASKFLDDLMLKLEEHNIIEHFEKIPTTGMKESTSPEFTFFENKKGEWTWDIKKWEIKYAKMQNTLHDETLEEDNFQKRFKELDIRLLSEITKGSEYYHKQIDFAKRFKVSPVQITRRLNFLNQNVVNYRLLYSRAKIQIVDLVLFRGKCSEERRNKLFNLIKSNPIPFDSGFEILQDGFMWRMNVPPAYTSLFGEFLWKISTRLNLYSFDHTKSMLYYFYDANFDLEKKEWRASKDEVFDQPLQWIEKNLG